MGCVERLCLPPEGAAYEAPQKLLSAVLWGSSGGWWKFRYGAETCNTDLSFSGRVWPDKGRTLLCADANGVVVGGVTYDGTVPSAVSDFSGRGAMALFASPINGILYNPGKWRLYSFKAWTDRDDPAPALDLVPCRKAGEACLFDRASGAFLANCGTGSFAAGADVAHPRMERGIFWLEDEGKSGDGALYCAATNGMHGTQNFSRMLEVPPLVGPVLLEADVKGRDIERGTESHHAPKVYLRYTLTEVVAEIREIDPATPVITESLAYYYPPEMNVIYSLHPYQPHALTHCGTSLSSIHWSYPSYIDGVWWDRRQMRVNLEPAIRFQQDHPNARIYIGEFSCIAWVPGAAEWIRDMISLFEEYGWDWTYHAFREWQAWDVELEPQEYYDFNAYHMKPAADGARKRALLEGLSHNPKPPE